MCDVVACQLPEAGWWEQGGNSSSRNGRSLNRSNSSRGRSRSIQEAEPALEAAAVDLTAERAVE